MNASLKGQKGMVIKMKRKISIMAALTLVFTIGISGMSFAATKKKEETRTPITSISINVVSDLKADYSYEETSVLITSNDESLYSIGGYEWGETKEAWEPGDEPKLKIEVHARSGYYFNKVSGAAKVIVNGAEYKSVKKQNEDETLVVTVELSPAAGDLEITDNAEWLGYPLGKATWDAVDYAGAYELKLTRDNQIIFSVEKVSANSYDFYPQMTKSGTYQFRVRAVPKNTDEEKYLTASDWVYSDTLEIEEDEVAEFGTNTNGGNNGPNATIDAISPDNIGWVNDSVGWWYRNADGSYTKNSWQHIDNKWYLFGYDGYMLTGWQNKNGGTYYLGSNGDMQTGWIQDDREWYYFAADGSLQRSWILYNNQWYYADSYGRRVTGWVLDNGKWYYMDPNTGVMLTNTNINGYSINANGEMVL